MNWTTIMVIPITVLTLLACNEKAKNPAYFTPEGRQAADAVSQIPYIPTNPNGGIIAGKPLTLDPEENAKRQARNTSEPIIWGESIAGISLTTTYDEARKILAQRVNSGGGFEVYPESIQIGWRAAVPPTPEIILAFGTYGGRLKLPDPIGEVALGDNLSQHFTNDPNGNNFMRQVGAYFEGKDPATYDCRVALTCSIAFFNNMLFFEFKRGSIAIDSSFRMEMVYIVENQTFFPRLSGDVVYTSSSIGNFSLATTRNSFEAVVGPPQGANGGLSLYDDLNVIAAWNGQIATLIAVQSDYQGNILVPTVGTGTFKLGDSFAAYADFEDNGSELIRLLDSALHDRSAQPGYDCLDGEVMTCKIDVVQGSLLLQLQKGTFAFSNDAKRELLFVSMVPSRVSFLGP